MTSHRRNLLLWDLGFLSFRLWLNEHFFLPHGISIIIATVIGNTMAQQCVATRKIKISFNFYNSSLQCDLSISVARNIKEITQHLKKLAKFYAHKSKKYRGRWAITWALTLISSHFNQKYFLNVHSFPFAASYCIY